MDVWHMKFDGKSCRTRNFIRFVAIEISEANRTEIANNLAYKDLTWERLKSTESRG